MLERWIIGVVVGLMALGVAIAGCGSDSESEGGATAHVSKSKFLKSAESVCVAAKKERLAIGEEEYNKKVRAAGGNIKQDQFEQLGEELLTEKVIPSLRKEKEALEAVGTPTADQEKIEKMLQSMEDGTDELEQDGFAKISNNQFDPFEEEAKAYGLKCKVI